ncbi:MAG: ATP synthase F1 subunit gamma [bacterium]|nr:ATP synthase F1 subunit gamma [bacterium]MBK9472240.1 ATP synthase F1 subunit gamma [bacterium]
MAGAGVKLLNKRIRSVRSTQQITKAMKMVAAAKLARSQGRMLAARPYSRKLTELMQQLAGKAEIAHPLFEVRPVHKRLYVIITSDKGLCGSYNTNLLKVAHKAVDASIKSGVETAVYTIGRKGAEYFRKRGYTVFHAHTDFAGDMSADRGRLVGDKVVGSFTDGSFDEVRVVYAQFVSTMTQRPVDVALLPIAPEAAAEGVKVPVRGGAAVAAAPKAEQDYIWEPSQEELFAVLLPLYLRNRVFMTLSEAFTSEHAARMTSMNAATENAGEMIGALTLRRNRERQAAITSELLDIVGGANAL